MSETKFSPASSKIGWLWQIPYTEILKLEDCRFAAYGFFTGEKKNVSPSEFVVRFSWQNVSLKFISGDFFLTAAL